MKVKQKKITKITATLTEDQFVAVYATMFGIWSHEIETNEINSVKQIKELWENETVPMAFVSSVNVTSPTDATMLLGNFSRDPAATEFRLILEENRAVQGTYDFPSDTDCELVFASGTDIADLFYADLNGNFELDPGDEISIVNLTPDSYYEVTILYIPTGYESTYSSFWTPA